MGLEVRKIRALKGANVFALFPVIYAEVKLNEFLNISSKDVPGFIDKLLKLFPGLEEHKCSYGVKGGFVRRLKEGTYLPHISEHVAIEIMNMLGENVKFGKSIWIMDDVYWIAIEYRYEETSRLTLKYAIDIVHTLMQGNDISKEERDVYLNDIFNMYSKEKLGPSTSAILNAAKNRNIPISPIDFRWSMFMLGYGKYAKYISATVTSHTSLLSSDIAKDKIMSKKLLELSGIPVPKGMEVKDPDDAVHAAEEIGYPVVVKPLDSHHGKGVIGNIKTPQEVRDAFYVARRHSKYIVVEKYMVGDDYRFLVVNGKVVAVSKRTPPYIVGDGKSTVKELVDALNNNPLRGWGHENYLTKVKLGEEEVNYLKQQGFKMTDVVPKGEVVYLRRNANLSTGGTAEDVTDEICDEVRMAVERAAKVIGLDVCGVDAIIKDPKKPLGEGNGGIIEINTAPGLRMHLKPTVGKPRDVGSEIVNYLFPEGNGRIPIISITGTNGKTSVVRLVGKILERAGYHVGMTTTGGIYINGVKIISGDTTGPWSAGIVLRDKNVDVAVLECARGGIWRRGLAYDRAYIGCVLNIREDHIGVDGIENTDDIFWIKSVITEAVLPEGYSVVNGEDDYAENLLKRARGKQAVFSKTKNNIVDSVLKNGGKAVYVEDGWVIYHNGEEKEKVVKVSEIVYAGGGKITTNLDNSLSAILIAKLMNVSNENIREVLSQTTPYEFEGRFNVLEMGKKRIVVDYAHNPDAISKLKDFAKYMNVNDSWCVIAIPGDRKTELLIKNGFVAGTVFDHVFITAREKDLRGRDKKDLLENLKIGALKSGCGDVRVYEEWEDAVKDAYNEMQDGDALFILMGIENVEEIRGLLS